MKNGRAPVHKGSMKTPNGILKFTGGTFLKFEVRVCTGTTPWYQLYHCVLRVTRTIRYYYRVVY
jgi:hypothetical protein